MKEEERMTFQEFASEIVRRINRQFVDQGYPEGSVQYLYVQKPNGSYPGVMIKLPWGEDGQEIQACFNLKEFYRQFGNLPISQAEVAIYQNIQPYLEKSVITDCRKLLDENRRYDNVKPHLYVELCGIQWNREALRGISCQPVKGAEDLVFTACVDLGGGRFFRVRDTILKTWGISREQLFADAIEQGQKRYPPSVQAVFPDGMRDTEFANIEEAEAIRVTNRDGCLGAAALFYPGMLETLGKQCGDFYIVPKSIHEIFLFLQKRIPSDQAVKMEKFLCRMNREKTPPNERLSDQVYHYAGGGRKLERITAYLDRMDKGKNPISEKGKDRQLGQPGVIPPSI